MGLLNRIREHRERQAHKRGIKFRQRPTPYVKPMQSPLRAKSRELVEANNEMKATVREAFMSHPAATEEDFDRCWPELRDEIFKQYTMKVLEKMCT